LCGAFVDLSAEGNHEALATHGPDLMVGSLSDEAQLGIGSVGVSRQDEQETGV
jgi:hypothetical protein